MAHALSVKPILLEPLTYTSRVRGSLLGGAVGDALGAPVEFMSLAAIRKRFGPQGIRGYEPAYGRRGAITDDTQMTLFTAEGVMRSQVRAHLRGVCNPTDVIRNAYFRWLLTQGEKPDTGGLTAKPIDTDGWLFSVQALHSRRAPGLTCLSALRAAHHTEFAANNSKGCGGVMRVAPVGLFPAIGEDSQVFELAMDAARLTHGHPSGHLSAGYLAVVIAALSRGAGLHEALGAADGRLQRQPGHGEVSNAIARARELASNGPPDAERLESLGEGWVAEEALAMAVYCALTARSFADGVLLAVNHSGDSDSTGAITGNLLGALLGEAAIPAEWLMLLELRSEITRIADDLDAIGTGRLSASDACEAYPGG